MGKYDECPYLETRSSLFGEYRFYCSADRDRRIEDEHYEKYCKKWSTEDRDDCENYPRY